MLNHEPYLGILKVDYKWKQNLILSIICQLGKKIPNPKQVIETRNDASLSYSKNAKIAKGVLICPPGESGLTFGVRNRVRKMAFGTEICRLDLVSSHFTTPTSQP